jgi:hypothetical protein
VLLESFEAIADRLRDGVIHIPKEAGALYRLQGSGNLMRRRLAVWGIIRFVTRRASARGRQFMDRTRLGEPS